MKKLYTNFDAATCLILLWFQTKVASFKGNFFLYIFTLCKYLCAFVSKAASPELHYYCTNWSLHSTWKHSARLWRRILVPSPGLYFIKCLALPASHIGNGALNPCTA